MFHIGSSSPSRTMCLVNEWSSPSSPALVLLKSDFMILYLLKKQREKKVLYSSSNVFLMLSQPINNLREVTTSDCVVNVWTRQVDNVLFVTPLLTCFSCQVVQCLHSQTSVRMIIILIWWCLSYLSVLSAMRWFYTWFWPSIMHILAKKMVQGYRATFQHTQISYNSERTKGWRWKMITVII